MSADGARDSLEALGLAEAPRNSPLSYPGAWPTRSGLLDGDRLLPLDSAEFPGRTPVLAVGSNACPGQLRLKMAECHSSSPVPMVRARVTGIDVGVSAHVSLPGYVPASPVHSPTAVRELFVLWLDADQLAAVDASEPHYDRARLPDDVRVEPLDTRDPSALTGVFVYLTRHGVLHDGEGAPRRHPGQRALIAELLSRSSDLRDLFGRTPEEFCARARADARLCALGTRLFEREKWVTHSGLEHLRTSE